MSAEPPALPRLNPEVERSRESAARLLDAFARKLRRIRALDNAASGVERAAHYVQSHSLKDLAAAMERFARRRPAAALSIAIAAGFVAGRALGKRAFR